MGTVVFVCGRFTSTTPAVDLADYFGVDEVVAPELGPRYNVAPTDETYAVAESATDGTRRLGTFRWGLIPFWSKDPKGGAKMINARAEGLLDKPAFKRAFERKRCIVPADGFYEWSAGAGSTKKQPWYVTLASGEPMAFAGLWDTWRPNGDGAGRDARPIRSCTILTGEPNDRVAALHDRMPVILPRDVWDAWLDPANDDLAELQSLLVPVPSDEVVVTPVSTLVNTVTNDGPQLIEPATDLDEGAGTLFS